MSSVSSTNNLGSFLANSGLTTIGSSTTNSSSGITVPGLASGMNWTTVVQELGQAERAPETQWETQQTAFNAQNSDYTTISTELTTLENDITALQSASLYNASTVQSSNSSVATATSGAGTPIGSNTFHISQLATAAQY